MQILFITSVRFFVIKDIKTLRMPYYKHQRRNKIKHGKYLRRMVCVKTIEYLRKSFYIAEYDRRDELPDEKDKK